MAVEQEPSVTGGGAQAQPEVDYKAKYEEMRAHMREWERKAKANAAAADELEKLKASQMSDVERIQKQYEEEKARADRLQAASDRAAWVDEVSKETGVPSALLSLIAADSRDDLAEKAASISDAYGEKEPAKPQTVPVVLGDGKHAEAGKPAGDFIREQFLNMHR